MVPQLSKLLVNKYVLSINTCAYPVWEHWSVCYRKSQQNLLDRGLKLTCKGSRLFSSRALQRGINCINFTVVILSCMINYQILYTIELRLFSNTCLILNAYENNICKGEKSRNNRIIHLNN